MESPHMVSIWSPTNSDVFSVTLVPKHYEEEFQLNVEIGDIEVKDETIYIISHNCSSEKDQSLIKDVAALASKNKAFEEGIFSELRKKYRCYDFEGCRHVLQDFQAESTLSTRIVTFFNETFFLLEKLLKKLIIESPIKQDCNWTVSDINIHRYIKSNNSFPYLDHCSLLKFLRNNIAELEDIGHEFDMAKPYHRLAILSAIFLFNSKVMSLKSDFSSALVYLHRAVETCFKSWLLAENEISLDPNGKVINDGYTYLLGYKKKVKKIRSLTDSQDSAIEELNELRNNCKIAHGYFTIEKCTQDNLFSALMPLLEEDEKIESTYRKLENSYRLPHCFNRKLFDFFLKESYLTPLN